MLREQCQQRERRKSKEDKVKRHLESRFCGTARNRSSTHAGAPRLLWFFRLGVNVDFALCSDPRLVRWRVVVCLHRIRVLDLTPSTKQKSVSSIEWEISISHKISDRWRFKNVCCTQTPTAYLSFTSPIMVLWRCWLGGRKGIRPAKKMSGGVLAWLSVCSKLQTCICPSWCHCHSLSLASVKSRSVLPFWYRLTWVVPDKGPLNGCIVC